MQDKICEWDDQIVCGQKSDVKMIAGEELDGYNLTVKKWKLENIFSLENDGSMHTTEQWSLFKHD
jgi:hypothetical protein